MAKKTSSVCGWAVVPTFNCFEEQMQLESLFMKISAQKDSSHDCFVFFGKDPEVRNLCRFSLISLISHLICKSTVNLNFASDFLHLVFFRFASAVVTRTSSTCCLSSSRRVLSSAPFGEAVWIHGTWNPCGTPGGLEPPGTWNPWRFVCSFFFCWWVQWVMAVGCWSRLFLVGCRVKYITRLGGGFQVFFLKSLAGEYDPIWRSYFF